MASKDHVDQRKYILANLYIFSLKSVKLWFSGLSSAINEDLSYCMESNFLREAQTKWKVLEELCD